MSKKYKKNSSRSIIHAGKGRYVKRSDGKRHDKRTCVWYEKNSQKCTCEKCHKSICDTATNCTIYERKPEEKTPKKKSLPYYIEYLDYPEKQGIHENISLFNLSQNIGTPCHTTFLASHEKRRNKSRCVYYTKKSKYCNFYLTICSGSSRCEKYIEK